MRFWILYYAIFGPKYTRWALLLFALGMALFFFCFVHEAFDSPRPLQFRTHRLPVAPDESWTTGSGAEQSGHQTVGFAYIHIAIKHD